MVMIITKLKKDIIYYPPAIIVKLSLWKVERRYPIYIGVIECKMKNVTAKSEFPIRSVADVPFLDVCSLPKDETPFDISDIIVKRKNNLL